MSKQAATQDKGTNIQVVVRCRGKNERERKENSPTVIDVPQIRGKELTVRGTATTRQYHFDRVFGPQADQELVYREIVSPILDEVMQGYNCTIFAYGQTGTGKTYTMEGDMDLDGTPQSSIANTPQSSRVPTPANFSSDLLNGVGVPPHSGIIPRTLRRLFYALDKLSAEYYVHVSYLELYNEELRDLLAGGDINDELNNPRAMNGFEHSSNLKIYESGTDKGVIVQGLEEKIVTNAHDAISLMQTGSLRRKVAATRCNDASSRSHAIFTITVFIRERAVTVEGEDIVKLGKLNLVDLAGSENIGRSGAENIRAREAANINKSLLTLGRVINALVEKHSHVPYRDSKLTRILKDSLGGRTRTCLIATISPAKANVEETLKTLDYANQAKSIRNKPEANKKVSKSDIVNDMQMYIERLRNDLEAARDSNGFFVTKETYEELTTEAKESKKLVDEWKQRVAIWEEEMKRMHEEFNDLTRQNELAKAKLEETESTLAHTQNVLDTTRTDLSHQKFISRAHAKHESALDSTARLLYSSLSTSSRDAAELHSKIARMSERERLNLQAVAQISQLVGSETKRALDSVAEYNNNADTQTKRLLSTLQERVGESFEAAVAGKIREYEDKLNTQISGIVERALESGVSSRAACKSSIASVEELLAGLKTTIDGLAQECVGACTDYASEVQEFSNRQTESITARTENINSLMATCVSDLTALLSESQANAAQIITNLASEIEKLELQNQQMTRDFESKIESFKSRSEKADSSLLQKVKAMIEESREQEAAALQDLLSMTQSQSASSISNANGLLGHTKTVGDGVAHLSRSLLSRVASAQTAVQDSVEAEGRASLKLIESLIKSSKAHGKAVTKGFKSAQGGVASVQERAADVEAINIKHLDALYETLVGSAKETSALSVAAARSTSEIINGALSTWSDARSELCGLARMQSEERSGFAAGLNRGILAIAETVDRETASGIRPTENAGMTPKKRKYQSVSQWNRTLPQQDILARLVSLSASAQELEDEQQLEWTGLLVKPDAPLPPQHHESAEQQPLNANGDSVPSAETLERVSTPTERPLAKSPSINGDANTPEGAFVLTSPDVRTLGKRTSETAISPASDAATLRPTRRARTRASRRAEITVEDPEDPSTADYDQAAESVSAIPLPSSTSRLPVPRRSRRARN